jgi:hypothetical protein
MADILHRVGVKGPAPEKVYDALTTLDGLSGWWIEKTSGNPGLGEPQVAVGAGGDGAGAGLPGRCREFGDGPGRRVDPSDRLALAVWAWKAIAVNHRLPSGPAARSLIPVRSPLNGGMANSVIWPAAVMRPSLLWVRFAPSTNQTLWSGPVTVRPTLLAAVFGSANWETCPEGVIRPIVAGKLVPKYRAPSEPSAIRPPPMNPCVTANSLI